MPRDHVEGVKGQCPNYFCFPEKIELWNCGPIVRLRCPECGFGISEAELSEGKSGLEELVKLWNQKGLYMVCD